MKKENEAEVFRQAEAYLRNKKASIRELDALEDIRSKIGSCACEEDLIKLLKRMELLIESIGRPKASSINTELEAEKKRLEERVKKQINSCRQYCSEMIETEIQQAIALDEEFAQNMRSMGNVEANAEQMENRQRFQRLVDQEIDKLERQSGRALQRVAAKVAEEYEHTMETVCRMFEREEEPELSVSKKEIYNEALSQQDLFSEKMRLKEEGLRPDVTEIKKFSETCGVALEIIAVKANRKKVIMQWLPVLLVIGARVISYIVNTVKDFQQIASGDKMNWIEVIIKLFGEGWLFIIFILSYFYIKWVNKKKQAEKKRAFQEYLTPELEALLKEYSLKEKFRNTLNQFILETEQQYGERYQFLFKKIIPAQASSEGERDSELQHLKEEIAQLY